MELQLEVKSHRFAAAELTGDQMGEMSQVREN
jgi:hypothetical protein